MAWGFFNKIKKGLKKAFNFTKDKILKPAIDVGKKVAPTVANLVVPGSGQLVKNVIDTADDFVNDGGAQRILNDIRSGKIRLK